MGTIMKTEIVADGYGFTLVWRCWVGHPLWYLNNQLTLMLPDGQIPSRIARDRIEDTYDAAKSMSVRTVGDLYLTEGQGFQLEVLRDLGAGEIQIEVMLNEHIGFRGKILSTSLGQLLGGITLKIQSREIPALDLRNTSEWNRTTDFVPRFETDFSRLRMGFRKDKFADVIGIVSTSEAPGIYARSFSVPLATWILILETALLQLTLDEHASSHQSHIKLGLLEFEIDRDDESFNAILCVGVDCYIVAALEPDQPYQNLRSFLTGLKSSLVDEFAR